MVWVAAFITTAICTKDSGSGGSAMGKEPYFCKVESAMWAFGSATEGTDRVHCGCKIRKPNTLASSCRTKSMERGRFSSQTAR